MTSPITNKPVSLELPSSPGRFRLPDIPQREPDEVTQFDQLFKTGRSHALAVHSGQSRDHPGGGRPLDHRGTGHFSRVWRATPTCW